MKLEDVIHRLRREPTTIFIDRGTGSQMGLKSEMLTWLESDIPFEINSRTIKTTWEIAPKPMRFIEAINIRSKIRYKYGGLKSDYMDINELLKTIATEFTPDQTVDIISNADFYLQRATKHKQ